MMGQEPPIFDNQTQVASQVPPTPFDPSMVNAVPDVKKWYESSTIVSNSIGVLVILLEIFLQQTVYPLPSEWQSLITAVLGLVIAIANIINRVRMKDPTIVKPVTL